MSDAAFLDLFKQLAALGQFRMSRLADGTWWATVEFPAPKGVTAKVESGFRRTPLEALQHLHDRLGGLREMVNVPAPVPGITHREIAP